MNRRILLLLLPAIILLISSAACRLVTPFTGGLTLPADSTSTPTLTLTTPPPPSPTLAPPTSTPSPTATVTYTQEPTATPTQTPEPPKPFSVLAGAPQFSQAFLHSDLGCAWMGVAGQVFGLDGTPLSNLVVSVTGTIGAQSFAGMGYTGAAAGYGPGGYEIKLSDLASPGVFWIQILDLEGKNLTDPFNFEMSGRCGQNLAIVNFVQVAADY